MKNNKIKIFLFIFFILFSYFYFVNKIDMNENSYNINKYNISVNNYKRININSNLKKIKIFQKTKQENKYNSIEIVIKDKKKEIFSQKIIGKEFLKYGYYVFDTANIKLTDNKEYYFSIKSQPNDINYYSLNLYYPNNVKLWFHILFIFIIIIFSLIYYFINIKKIDIFNNFYKIAIPIFLLYIIFIPITAGHDEEYHLIKINEIVSGRVIPIINSNKTGAYLPKDVDLNLNYYDNYKYRDYFNKFYYNYNSPLTFLSAGSIDVYSPVQYIPQTIGVFISKQISNNVIIAAYIGRLFNALTCILLLSCAFKIIPIGKKILFFFLFNPLAIECFTTLSGDGITICLGILLVSYIFKIMKSDKITNKDIFILSLISCILALCKIIYIIMPFLILLIPKSKYENTSRLKCIIYVIILPIILNLIWLLIASSISYGASPYSVPSKNLLFLLHNPFRFIKYFLYSIETYGFKIISEFFGNKLLMGEIISNNTIVPIMMIIAFIYIIKDKNEKKILLSKSNIICISIILILLIIATFLSVYIFYIPYCDLSIWIVQGRYFFPEILIIYLLISSLIKQESKKYTNDLIFFTIVIVNIMSLMEIIVNYL